MGQRAPRLALLRLSGEIAIKARATRMQFRRQLLRNLRDALASSGIEPRIEVSHDRLYVELPEGVEPADLPLARVFGISSWSLVERHPGRSLAEVVQLGEGIFRDAVEGRHFAVRARRVGRKDPDAAPPREVERELGALLLPLSAGVDLGNPEVTLGIEISETGSSFFTEGERGAGGLPLGCEGRAVSLLSGGFDSAVASWQLQKRGVVCELLFFNLGGAAHLAEVVRVAKHLADRWSYGARPRLHAVDFEPVAEALRAHTARRYWQVLLKRSMLRAAEAVAEEIGAEALVTGDAVGQVSSQTLSNLAVVSRATRLPVLRPLVGLDKDEITARAREIGTYALSEGVGEYCALVARRPATRAKLDAVEAEEAKLPEDLLPRLVEQRSSFDLRALELADLEKPELAVESLPDGAVLIDLRPLPQYRNGHHPDALHLPFPDALAAYPSFDRSGCYVLCCEYGLLSAQLAEHMQRDGFRAHHFRGGQRALMKSVETT